MTEQTADKETFAYWVTHPQELEASDLIKIEATTASYPYCQVMHILAAKCASNALPARAPELISRAAAYSVNRYALKNLVNNDPEWNGNIVARLTDIPLFKKPAPAPSGLPPAPGITESREPGIPNDRLPEKSLTSDNELLVNEAVNQSLSRIQQMASDVPIPSEKPLPGPENDQKKIIEKFIDVINTNGPNRIAIDESDQFEDLSMRSQTNVSNEFVTEALAQIFVRQGKIEKAIQIYQQLILKKPEKIDYFAEKIKELK